MTDAAASLDALATARRGLFTTLGATRQTTWIEAVGPSMRPLIVPGDQLLVEFGARPTARGQVVVLAWGNRIVAHRVVAWDRRSGAPRVRTKGDAEPFADPPLPEDAVLGVVVAVRHGPSGTGWHGGLVGRPAAAIAAVSWSSDRLVRASRRLTRRLPGPVGVPVLHAIQWIAAIPPRITVVLARRGPDSSVRKEVRTG